MRLKRFRASTVAGAMALIRDQLGPDALILGTQRVADGVEVTAATEAEPDPAPIRRETRFGFVDEGTAWADDDDPPEPPRRNGPAPPRAAMLAWHGVPPSLAAALQAGDLTVALGARLRFAALSLAADRSPPLLVAGPPGAGKTLTIARLATRLVLAGLTPMVITADGQRAGATEQLLAFTRVLGISLIVADHPALLTRALARRANQPVLIDTPGLNPDDPECAALLAAFSAAGAATTALVLPAGLDPNEAADLASRFANAGATHLVATRLDLCRRMGGILAAADAGDLALSEAGVGPGAADGLQALTPAFLAGRLREAPGAPVRAHRGIA